MNDEAFLRAMVAAPEETAPRLRYADWLEQRGDFRAELLRTDWDVPRLSYVDWVASRGDLSYYLQTFPDLHSHVHEHDANQWWRDKRTALGDAIDPAWTAVVDTLGRPFQPFFFWNNTGPRSYEEGQLPFQEQIGTRGTVITFESAFRGDKAWQPGLVEDLVLLCQLNISKCEYGAATCPAHPFIAELATGKRQLTGSDILRALKVSDFRSQHIQSIDATEIPYPDYHPGTDNDEIHNDQEGQYLFPRPKDFQIWWDDAWETDGLATRQGAHDALRGHLVDGRLWYVLLHSRTGLPADSLNRCPWVVLFAVGQSLRESRLLGVISHQLCHNFCD